MNDWNAKVVAASPEKKRGAIARLTRKSSAARATEGKIALVNSAKSS
jgi:hypothetical protein